MPVIDVSVIVVSWNTREILRDCLESVYSAIKGISFEIIVVDNASTDGSVKMLKKDFIQVILIKNSKNRGFAAANNQGISIAKGRYVLLLNSDTFVLNQAISKVVSFADDNPEAAVVGGRVLNPDKSLQPTCFMFPSLLNLLISSTYLYKLFPKSKFFGREQMTWWNRNDEKEVDVVTGCFMLVRREAIEQVGTMDEQFFMYGEETDWCYRFKQSGWKILFTPCAKIIHHHGASTKTIKPLMALQLRGSILLFFKKHSGRFTYALACLLISVFFILRVPYWLGRAIFSRYDRNNPLQNARAYIMGAFRALLGARGLCTAK